MYNPYFYHKKQEGQEEQESDPVEWEYDNNGSKFRRIGNVIEYAPTIETTNGIFYKDDAGRQLERMKQKREEQLKAENAKATAIETGKRCPFKIARSSHRIECRKDCSFYDESGCIFATAPTEPTTNTDGKFCPIIGKCYNRCAMYSDGCRLIETIKCMKYGKEHNG